ncbi:head GIN domain-containing protein [uncultured Dokdonia sp.]|uniref:head GIN domain-containing protein n=1 Tax=uncultured Dokdonia sp. TaxID=575653 RepID=UPI00260A653B|nr:head GIN domain-containing protein [uncultured Dokdonia sp.]
MKKLITLSLVLFASTQIHAQWWGKSVKGNGELETITRNVGDYDEISVAGFFDVTLVAGNEGELTIEGESNLLEYIETEVDGDRLTIKVKNKQNLKTSWGKDIKIRVPFRDLNQVSLSGSGEIMSTDVIKANNFRVSVSGSGDINLVVEASSTESRVTGSGDLVLRGSTRDHETSVTGSGDLEAGRFKADNVDAKVTGSGDIRVSCDKSIRARVTGSGDIEYVGNPTKQDTKVSGSGDISRG